LAPASGVYTVRDDGVTTGAGTEAQLRLERDPDSTVFRISGSLPLDAPPRPLMVAVTEPAEHAAGLLLRLLQARGVRVEGHARARHAGDPDVKPLPRAEQSRVLAEHVSVPLIEDVRATNKLSLNLHAELMLRVAARESADALTMDDALAFAAQFRQKIGLAPEDVLLTDGSGLSRSDLVTPQAMVQILQYASRQTWGADFLSTLPVAGQDGTLESRMKGTAAAGRVHAKTGSFDHVNGLSGYVTTVRGERLVFSIMGNANGLRFSDATNIVDAVCVAMVEELGPAGTSATIP
jgi:D-alanyl-D-alanine carboxypeptidase/D-alanyl-D-alanine-endopeptidase (penicillin-binding protein 4)